LTDSTGLINPETAAAAVTGLDCRLPGQLLKGQEESFTLFAARAKGILLFLY